MGEHKRLHEIVYLSIAYRRPDGGYAIQLHMNSVTMKYLLLPAMACLLLFSAAFGQSKVPQVTQDAFQQQFPAVSKVKWKESSASSGEAVYTAEYKVGQSLHAASYNAAGTWLQTKSPVAYEALPEVVQTNFIRNYGDFALTGTAKVDMADGSARYIVEVKANGKPMELTYSAEGAQFQ